MDADEPIPGQAHLAARLAAMDQKMAHLDDRLSRSHRDMRIAGGILMVTAAATVIMLAIARPVVPWWVLAGALVTVIPLVAGDFVLGLMIRDYRAEIRELRARQR